MEKQKKKSLPPFGGSLVGGQKKARKVRPREARLNSVLPLEQSDGPLSRDELLEELSNLERYEVELASDLRLEIPEKFEAPLLRRASTAVKFIPKLIPERIPESQLSVFWNSGSSEGVKSQKKRDVHEQAIREIQLAESNEPPHTKHGDPDGGEGDGKIRNFAFVSGTFAVLLLVSFFVQKGVSLKDISTIKSAKAYENFRVAEASLKSLDFDGAAKSFSSAYAELASLESSLEDVGGLTNSLVRRIPALASYMDSSKAALTAGKHIAKAGEILSSAGTLLPLHAGDSISPELFLGIFSKENGSEGNDNDGGNRFEMFGERAKEAGRELLRAEAAIQGVEPSLLPQEFQKTIFELRKKLPVLEDLVGAASDYSGLLSQLLGEDSPKRYLIVFQNSSEMRPTGGFIGSYAILGIANDKIKEMEVKGIYDADGQLTVNVIPPKPIQHIATAWSTHDANWFFDFPASAKKISWFFENTGEEKIDGVMTLNIELIEKLLRLTGAIHIVKYDLTLDAQNFRDEVQYEVEAGYDKKVNHPKQILADFAPLFFERLYEVWKDRRGELLPIFFDALGEKNIMLYFKNNRLEEFVKEHGWTGSIKSQIPNPKSQPFDYLAVVHSNIGGYKTNKFMDQEVAHRVEIKEDGAIVDHLSLKQSHKGGDNKYWWYNKPNIDYVKIYAPKGSKLVSSSGGKKRDLEKPVDYAGLQFIEDPDIHAIEETMSASGVMDVFEESGKTVFGTWVVTKPKAVSVLEIEYTLPFHMEFEKGEGSYSLYFQKQAGTRANVQTTLHIPANWQMPDEGLREQSFVLDKDREIQYTLRR